MRNDFFGPAVAKYESILCCICNKVPDECKGNDVIMCDGSCRRAYHQKCLYPVVKKSDIPPGDQKWLCHLCKCEKECLRIINRAFKENFKSVEDLWPALLGKPKSSFDASLTASPCRDLRHGTSVTNDEEVRFEKGNLENASIEKDPAYEISSGKYKKKNRKAKRIFASKIERKSNKRSRMRFGKPWVVTWEGQIRIRSSPGLSGKVKGCLNHGDVVQVIERKGNWVRHSKGWSLVQDDGDELMSPHLEIESSSAKRMQFSSKREKKSSVQKQTSAIGKHKCPHCPRMFTTHMGLGGHMRMHNSVAVKTGETPLGTKWPQKKRRDGMNSFDCDLCELKFSSEVALDNHKMDQHANKKGTTDPLRGTNEQDKSGLIEDSETENESSFDDVTEPLSKPGDTKQYECPVCFKTFKTGKGLGGHKRIHNIKPRRLEKTNRNMKLSSKTMLVDRSSHVEPNGHTAKVRRRKTAAPKIGQKLSVRFRGGMKYNGTITKIDPKDGEAFKLTIRYDDGTLEHDATFPDPDIQIRS
eukprot:CAMPEP_0114527016 /NCGR_PEP_ID=MMETSP0109-20121206/23374_1 /TAXON_ID=29199 /ORGANISM="Chlorarachnion reptans, Strain CCCM449" /LENGTH=526 /DNA_ID=CAMNT_0001708919 /DNA_START=54 /DNA_END=1635 /DNA_ORIENTATION=+